MSRAALAAYAGLAVVGLGWGATVVTGKLAASTGHHPIGLVFWQQAFTVAALGAALTAAEGRRWIARLRLRRNLGFYGGVALIGTVLPNGVFYAIAPHLPAGVIALMVSMTPMFSLAVALSFGMEPRSLRRAAGVGLGAVAIAMIVAPEAGLPERGAWVFVVVGMLTPFFYGCESIFVARRMPAEIDPIVAIFGASLLGAAMTAPLLAAPEIRIDLSRPWGVAEWALLVGSLLHAGVYSGYVALVRIGGPVFASLVSYLVTSSGVAWGVILLGEAHSGWFWAALAVMLAGMGLVQPRRADAAPV